MADESVQVCCTSPPYWALRKYEGVEPTAWPEVSYQPMPGLAPVTVPALECCLGLEPTPEAYVGHLVLIFREVFRALRRDGTLWLNLGDSFATTGGETGRHDGGRLEQDQWKWSQPMTDQEPRRERRIRLNHGLKPKDLCGIPHRVAFALQADGWYWRQTINWQKLSPMPQSVRDRPTTATEEIFLLARSATYFYDIDACRVPQSDNWTPREFGRKDANSHGLDELTGNMKPGTNWEPADVGRNLWNWWDIAEDGTDDLMPAKLRWLLSNEPLKEKHYAAYPSTIPYRAFALGSSAHGCCAVCGAPHRRVTEKTKVTRERPNDFVKRHGDEGTGNVCANSVAGTSTETLGWKQTCDCVTDLPPLPCLCMDIFSGSGTSGMVARALAGVSWESRSARSTRRCPAGESAPSRRW